MEILGIGPSELIFIIIIALIVLGPKDMQKAGKTIGKFLRTIVTSDGWKAFQKTSRELRTLPNRLMREANEEVNKIGNDIGKDLNASDPAQSRSGSIPPSKSWRPVLPTAPVTKTSPPENPDTAQAESTDDKPESNA